MLRAPRSLPALVALLALPAVVLAQGSLTPPGAPAPTMRSLDDLTKDLTRTENRVIDLAAKSEPRIAVDTLSGDPVAMYIITAPGSYYLRGNVTVSAPDQVGIWINAPDVTLDLNGFAVTGPGRAVSFVNAIQCNQARVHVRNGSVVGWMGGVIGGSTSTAEQLRVSQIKAQGIALDPIDSLVRNCDLRSVGAAGIYGGTVTECTVVEIGDPAFAGEVVGIRANIARGCTVGGVVMTAGSSDRAVGIRSRTASMCYVTSISSSGAAFGMASLESADGTVEGCTVTAVTCTSITGATGISSGTVRGSTVHQIGDAGTPQITGINAAVIESCKAIGVNSLTNSLGLFGTVVRSSRSIDINSGSSATGIVGTMITGCQVQNVTAGSTGGGIRVIGGLAEGNSITGARSSGIEATLTSVIRGNVIQGIGAGVTNSACILVSSNDGKIEDNTVVGGADADYGVRVTGLRNLVTGNRVVGAFTGAPTGATIDTPRFNLNSGNRFGTLVASYAATGEITATNAFANFTD